MEPRDLPGAVTLVTGAGSGIGGATAPAFAAEDAQIVGGETAEKAARDCGGRFFGVESAGCTSKAAVLASSRCPRADWNAAGVGVTAICPGVIGTPIIDATWFAGERSKRENVAKTKKALRKGRSPELVLKAIDPAVQKNRAVATVGVESWLGSYASRLLPTRADDRLARTGDQ